MVVFGAWETLSRARNYYTTLHFSYLLSLTLDTMQ